MSKGEILFNIWLNYYHSLGNCHCGWQGLDKDQKDTWEYLASKRI